MRFVKIPAILSTVPNPDKVYQFVLMKENVHPGAHAMTSLMCAPSVIMF